MFRNVILNEGGDFECLDEFNRYCFIDKSISMLFHVSASDIKVSYKEITYRNISTLNDISDYLKMKDYDKDIINSIVVRCGWMDKNLNSLQFIPLTDLIKRIRSGEASSKEKRKLQEICKQLSLSMRDIVH